MRTFAYCLFAAALTACGTAPSTVDSGSDAPASEVSTADTADTGLPDAVDDIAFDTQTMDVTATDTIAFDTLPTDVIARDATARDATARDATARDVIANDVAHDVAVTDAPPADAASCTFTQVQSTVFTGCSGFPSCHTRAPFGGSLDLTTANAYSQLVRVVSVDYPPNVRVVPGHPNTSFLYRKLTNMLATDGSEGGPMPRFEALPWHELPADEITLVRCWIAAGALNN